MAQSKATEPYLGGSQGSEKCRATKCGSVAPAILSCLIHSSTAYHPHPYLTYYFSGKQEFLKLSSPGLHAPVPSDLTFFPHFLAWTNPISSSSLTHNASSSRKSSLTTTNFGQGPPPWAPTAS